jgi:hypothetical protein
MPNVMKVRPVGGGVIPCGQADRRTDRRMDRGGEPLFAFLRTHLKTVEGSSRGIFENVQ